MVGLHFSYGRKWYAKWSNGGLPRWLAAVHHGSWRAGVPTCRASTAEHGAPPLPVPEPTHKPAEGITALSARLARGRPGLGGAAPGPGLP